MIDEMDIRARVQGHSIIRGIDPTPRGHLRLETAFLYPEGSSVDVFLLDDAPLLPPTRLSDLGNTSQWLLDVQVRPWLSKKRQGFVSDVLSVLGVVQQGGALEVPLDTLDGLIDGIVRLGQACVRVADLVYTKRSSLLLPVTEEVEELIADAELEYVANPELEGRFGKPVKVDFLVSGARSRSAVLTLSTPNSSQAHGAANEVFRKWYDLNIPTRSEQRVTIFDDRYDSYRDEDIRRLRDLSEVLALADRTAIRDLLAA